MFAHPHLPGEIMRLKTIVAFCVTAGLIGCSQPTMQQETVEKYPGGAFCMAIIKTANDTWKQCIRTERKTAKT
jgi:hypothetical protein